MLLPSPLPLISTIFLSNQSDGRSDDSSLAGSKNVLILGKIKLHFDLENGIRVTKTYTDVGIALTIFVHVWWKFNYMPVQKNYILSSSLTTMFSCDLENKVNVTKIKSAVNLSQ